MPEHNSNQPSHRTLVQASDDFLKIIPVDLGSLSPGLRDLLTHAFLFGATECFARLTDEIEKEGPIAEGVVRFAVAMRTDIQEFRGLACMQIIKEGRPNA